ncbi:HTH_48 domain-containing protein [Trichonephila clavipes]|nr:HTH_48 domain-containing protein [Trichonephila clavipes]
MRMRTNSWHTLLVKRRHLHWYCCNVVSDVYGPNAMSSSKVRKWVRASKDGRENVHDQPRSGRPSVITDHLVNAMDEKIR